VGGYVHRNDRRHLHAHGDVRDSNWACTWDARNPRAFHSHLVRLSKRELKLFPSMMEYHDRMEWPHLENNVDSNQEPSHVLDTKTVNRCPLDQDENENVFLCSNCWVHAVFLTLVGIRVDDRIQKIFFFQS
jgi:hypothetical protein